MSEAAPDRLLLRLRWRAALVLWTETLCHMAMPAAFILAAWLVAVIFGLGGFLLLVTALILALVSLGWEATRIRLPRAADIDRRIERASGLKHRPLLTLQDELETENTWGTTLWAAHQARAAASLAQARTGWPAPLAALRDPYSLRALLWLLFVTGLVIAGPALPARFSGAFSPPAWPIFSAPQVNAWITPPAYTGQAPLLLTRGQDLAVLQGSRLTVVVNGSSDAIRFAGIKLPTAILAAHSRRADGVLTMSGVISIGPWWDRLARWRVMVLPPGAPVLSLAPITLVRGTPKLSWQASDPYGLASLQATLRPRGYPHALPEGTSLPTTTGKGTAQLGISDTPYGGLTVNATLQAKNLAGLSAVSDAQAVTLPLAPLHDRTAQLLGIARQNLALMPERASSIARQLMQTAQTPPSRISYAVDVQLAALATAMRLRDTSPTQSVARLLALIRQIEAGPDYAASQAFTHAAQALLQALTRGHVDPNALNRLLQAMQQALVQHLAALAQASHISQVQMPQNFDRSALSRLAQQIAADQQAGRSQQAQTELQQLTAALQALQAARPMSAAEAARAQAAAQSAQALSQLMQNQARLLDQTAKGNATAGQQGQLRAGLQSLGAGLQKAGISNLPGLSRAGRAMQTAQSALSRQDNGPAQSAESAAIQNLQQAAAALQSNMQQGMSLDATNGRMPGAHGLDDSQNGSNDDDANPDLGFQRRNPADAIEQEIIKRDADPSLPAATHHYLRRLLTPDN
jgi:hypothetical protein